MSIGLQAGQIDFAEVDASVPSTLEGDAQQVSMALTADHIGMANNARWSDERVEELFAKAVGTVDEEERTAIHDGIFTIVQEEAASRIMLLP